MRYLQLATAILCAVTVQSAHADPIPTFHATQATMVMGPNTGSGENVLFSLTGPGVDLAGIGGMGCFEWCTGQPIPVDTLTITSQIFISTYTSVVLGGVSYEPSQGISFQDPLFNDSGTLNTFSTGFVGEGPTFTQFNLTSPNSSWVLNFGSTTDQEGNPAIFFKNGTFSATAPLATPEPATIVLTLTGSVGAGWITKRRSLPVRDADA
jgi:hypothetical protein